MDRSGHLDEGSSGAGNSGDDDDGPPVDEEGEERVCIACQRRKEGGKPYKHGHAPFCEKSIYYGLSEEQMLALKEDRSSKLKDTKQNVLRRLGLATKDKELRFPRKSHDYPKVCDVPADLSAGHLSALVNANDNNPSRAPRGVTVILRYLQMLAPNLVKGTNQVIVHDENMRKLEFFRSIFPRGCISFIVPKEDPLVKPNPHYRVAEGCKLLLVRWELQTDETIKCPFCKAGESTGNLMYRKLSFSRTSVKPIVDIDGKLAWSVGSQYRCTRCEMSVQATDPELIQSLPLWMQDAYPVSHNWINRVKTFQIGRRLSGLIETVFVGEGYDGHFISFFLRKLYDAQYKVDYKLLVESCEIQGLDGPKKEDWSFEKWFGDFTFPLGDFLREAFEHSRQQGGTDPLGVHLVGAGQGSSSPQRHHHFSGQAKRPPPPYSHPGGPITPKKRQARPEEYLDHSKPPGLAPRGPPLMAHPLAPHPPHPYVTRPTGLPPPSVALAPTGSAKTSAPPPGASPTVSPHTPTPYSQWRPSYGPPPPFPMHYSPSHQPPPQQNQPPCQSSQQQQSQQSLPPPNQQPRYAGFSYPVPPPRPDGRAPPTATRPAMTAQPPQGVHTPGAADHQQKDEAKHSG